MVSLYYNGDIAEESGVDGLSLLEVLSWGLRDFGEKVLLFYWAHIFFELKACWRIGLVVDYCRRYPRYGLWYEIFGLFFFRIKFGLQVLLYWLLFGGMKGGWNLDSIEQEFTRKFVCYSLNLGLIG